MSLAALKKMREETAARAAEFEAERNRVRPEEFKPVDGTKYDIKFITDFSDNDEGTTVSGAPAILMYTEHSVVRGNPRKGGGGAMRVARNNEDLGQKDLIAELYRATGDKAYAPKKTALISLIAHDLTDGSITPYVWKRGLHSSLVGSLIDFYESDGSLTEEFYRLVRKGSGLKSEYQLSADRSVQPFDYEDVEAWNVEDAITTVRFENQLNFFRPVILPEHMDIAEAIVNGKPLPAEKEEDNEDPWGSSETSSSTSEWDFG